MNNIPSKGLALKLQASGSPGLEWVEWELSKGVTPALICHPFIDPSSNLCPDFEVPQRPLYLGSAGRLPCGGAVRWFTWMHDDGDQ